MNEIKKNVDEKLDMLRQNGFRFSFSENPDYPNIIGKAWHDTYIGNAYSDYIQRAVPFVETERIEQLHKLKQIIIDECAKKVRMVHRIDNSKYGAR